MKSLDRWSFSDLIVLVKKKLLETLTASTLPTSSPPGFWDFSLALFPACKEPSRVYHASGIIVFLLPEAGLLNFSAGKKNKK